MEKHIQLPLTEELAKTLHAGDTVYLTGTIYTSRDAGHKRMCEALARGEKIPFDPTDATIYYVGPTPAKPGQVIGSAGPTTSGRMDAYAPTMMSVGARGMIGKGASLPEGVEAMKKYHGVYFGAIGGAGALLAKCIKKAELIAYEDLGAEALRRLEVEDMPLFVFLQAFRPFSRFRPGSGSGQQFPAEFLRQMRRGDPLPVAEHRRPLHEIAQLPHIAGKEIAFQNAQGLGRKLRYGQARAPRARLQKKMRQQGDVLPPLPQRRNGDIHHAQAVKQILAEVSLRNGLIRRNIDAGEHPHIHVGLRDTAHPPDHPVLQHPQELGLDADVHGIKFIQQKGAVVGLLEKACPGFRSRI